MALAGLATIVDALPRVVDQPGDHEARSDMLTGSMLAGRCLQNASMGIHHGLAQLVGGRTGIPHGLANALILEAAMRYNAEAVPEAMARMARALDVDDAPAAVGALVERLGLNTSLSEVGMTTDDLDAVARLSQSSPSVRANPRPGERRRRPGAARVDLLTRPAQSTLSPGGAGRRDRLRWPRSRARPGGPGCRPGRR